MLVAQDGFETGWLAIMIEKCTHPFVSLLFILQASARKERLMWNNERTLLSRKLAEAEARARETADGMASPEEVSCTWATL